MGTVHFLVCTAPVLLYIFHCTYIVVCLYLLTAPFHHCKRLWSCDANEILLPDRGQAYDPPCSCTLVAVQQPSITQTAVFLGRSDESCLAAQARFKSLSCLTMCCGRGHQFCDNGMAAKLVTGNRQRNIYGTNTKSGRLRCREGGLLSVTTEQRR